MGHHIFYFTGTGNSLAVARLLAQKTGTQLIPVRKAVSEESISGDIIGIVFPVYMFNAPKIVYEFMKKIRSCDYLYIVMTMAGESGKTAAYVRAVVAAKNIKLNAGFSILMPDNYIAWNGALEPEKQRELFTVMEAKIPRIIDIINSRKTHFDDEKEFSGQSSSIVPFPFNILPNWANQLFYDLAFRFIRHLDRSFKLNNGCNGCGICAKICPVDNIVMVDNKPSWRHRCEQCFACLQWCPQEAVEYGKKTMGRKRYHHPEVTIKEMAG